MLAYLPARYETVEKLTDVSTPRLSRIDQLRALHDALNVMIQPMENACWSGMLCVTSDMSRIVLRFSLRRTGPTYRKQKTCFQ